MNHADVLCILNAGIDTLAVMGTAISPQVPSLSRDSQQCLVAGRQALEYTPPQLSQYIIEISHVLERHVLVCNQLCNAGHPTFEARNTLRLQLALLCDALLDDPSDCDDSS